MNHAPDPSGIILPFADLWKAEYLIGGVDWTLRIEYLYYIIISLLFFKKQHNIKAYTKIAFILLICGILLKNFTSNFHLSATLSYIIYIFIGCGFYWKSYKTDKRYFFALILMAFVSWHLSDKPYHDHGNFFAYIALVIFTIFYLLRNKIKSTKFTQLLGNLTYPLYLSHTLYYGKILGICKFHIFAFFALLFICYLLHKFLEQVFINYGRKFAK